MLGAGATAALVAADAVVGAAQAVTLTSMHTAHGATLAAMRGAHVALDAAGVPDGRAADLCVAAAVPDGEAAAARLVVVSVAIALAAPVASEWASRRMRRS